MANKPIIGILGGVGAGKSTVAGELAKLGCKVIDCDEIAHKVIEEPAVRSKIIELFGPCIVDFKGRIDRGKLGAIVFGNGDKLKLLNRLVHGPVLRRTEQLIAKHRQKPGVKAIILDMPLLVEVGWADRCDRLIFVECATDRRVARAAAAGQGGGGEEIKSKENFQISLDKKRAIADNIIDNNSDISALARQVACIFHRIMKDG